MIFSSLQYFFFLPIVVFFYWRTRGSTRTTLLVAASYIFYMSWMPIYGILLFGLSSINWLLGMGISRAQESKTKKKILLWIGLLLNIGALCYYKYANFFLENIVGSANWLRAIVGHGATVAPWDTPVLAVVLPLGISFFVFEFVHYLSDVYLGNKPITSFMEFNVFASFFPSQIAGPIKRYQEFHARLTEPEQWSSGLFFEGASLIAQGLFKKIAIADPIGAIIFPSFAALTPISASDSFLAASIFMVQLYCDFSGYTDIGRGSALLLGIRLPINFDLPFLTRDLTDFWRRWHISLSSWIRDYIFIPMGGSRGGTLFNWRNLFWTMTIAGLWHGASWHYVAFGAAQGIGLIINREYRQLLKRFDSLRSLVETPPGIVAAVVINMLYVVAGFVFFRAPDMVHSLNIFRSLVNVSEPCTLIEPLVKSGVLWLIVVYGSFWLTLEYFQKTKAAVPQLTDKLQDQRLVFAAPVRLASWTAAIILIMAAKPTQAVPFVYFQF